MPTTTDSEIRDALRALRDVEPTDADIHRATTAARPPSPARPGRGRRPLRVAVAAGGLAAVVTAVVAGLPASDSERASAREVLLGAAAAAAQQPATPLSAYRYSRIVARLTRASVLRGCTTCIASATVEQGSEQWSPRDWREGTHRSGTGRIVERSGDERVQRELIESLEFDEGRLGIPRARLLADPLLQDIPFADLPTDPVALRDLLQAAVLDLRWAGRAREAVKSERDAINGGRRQTPEQARSLLVSGVVNILADANITPRLRSALFGVLATVEGARAVGRVSDPIGRPGEGVEFDIDQDDAFMDNPASALRIVVDPDTSDLLAVWDRQRDPREVPVPTDRIAPGVRELEWIPEAWTAYVRTGDVARAGERP